MRDAKIVVDDMAMPVPSEHEVLVDAGLWHLWF